MQINRSLEIDDNGELQDAGWVRKIRSALEDNAFQLVYQPIASLMGTNNNSYDVLVRMLDDTGEEILPGEFMPAAERTGLMPAIDRWVIEQAFSVSTQRAAVGRKSLMFLRVSEASLQDAGFGEWLAEGARKYNLRANSVVLQVSEAMAEHNLAQIHTLAAVCKNLHFQLSVANVGAHDNYRQLIQMIPMDYLVLDGCFMEDLDDPGLRMQLEEIVAAAKEKQIPTIATRVENGGELAELCYLGIDYVLGYHVQEPDDTMMEDVQLPA